MYFGQHWYRIDSGEKRAGRWIPYPTRHDAITAGAELISILKLCISVRQFRAWERAQRRKGLTPQKVQIDVPFAGPFFADIDAVPGQEQDAQNALTTTLNTIFHEHRLSPECIRLWFSGSKGFHLVIPRCVLGLNVEHKDLAIIYRELAMRLGLGHLIDRSVYKRSRGALWRVTGIQRDNGRHKIPITWRELQKKPFVELAELARVPRKNFRYPEGLQTNPSLQRLFERTIRDLLGTQEDKPKPDLMKPENQDTTEHILEPPAIRLRRVHHLELLIWSLPTWCAHQYDPWLRVGMALHYELEGGEDGLHIWDTWSRQSQKYDGRIIRRKWRSFVLSHQRPVTLRTVLDWVFTATVA